MVLLIRIKMKRLLQLSITIVTVFTLSATVYAVDKITVKTAKISEVAIYPERYAPATVVSLNKSVISARIAARVE